MCIEGSIVDTRANLRTRYLSKDRSLWRESGSPIAKRNGVYSPDLMAVTSAKPPKTTNDTVARTNVLPIVHRALASRSAIPEARSPAGRPTRGRVAIARRCVSPSSLALFQESRFHRHALRTRILSRRSSSLPPDFFNTRGMRIYVARKRRARARADGRPAQNAR